MNKGKFIVLYGINNLGKSTQAELLVEKLNQTGQKAVYLKYPIYELEPTGPKINEVLRGEKKQEISELDLQKLYVKNRKDYEPKLIETLNSGITIVAEDYSGTGIAWGVAKGTTLEQMEEINKNLVPEDIAIFLDGQRFIEAKEDNHIHESNDQLMNRCREVHQMLANRYDWQTVNANQTIEQVNQAIWAIIDQK